MSSSKTDLLGLSITLNKMAISKLLLDVFGEILGVGGGLVALQSFSTTKKDTNPFNVQSNELFLKFSRQQTAILKFLSDTFWENTRLGGMHPPITLNLKKGTKISNYQSNYPPPLQSLYDLIYLYL